MLILLHNDIIYANPTAYLDCPEENIPSFVGNNDIFLYNQGSTDSNAIALLSKEKNSPLDRFGFLINKNHYFMILDRFFKHSAIKNFNELFNK